MSSKILRRSGVAVVEYLTMAGHVPSRVFMAGVGGHCQEVDVMREMWPDIELYGWEPHPKTFANLLETFPGRIENKALSDKPGEIRMNSKTNWKDGASVHRPPPGKDKDWYFFEVMATTLNEAGLNMTQRKDGLLWMDCEGSELSVLMGGDRFINDNVVAINCEMTGRPRMDTWPKSIELHQWLTRFGFYQAWVHTIRPSICQFDAIYLHRDVFDPSLTCCMDSAMGWTSSKVLSCP